MTQVKLWQIVSQTPNGIVFADTDGTLKSLQAAAANQVLVAGPDGTPMWADNTALTTALDAKADVNAALATAKAYTEAQITALVNNAPIALDTLNELAQKLAGDETALNALIAQMEGKASKVEVAAQVAQAKQEALDAGNAYTDTAVSTAAGNLATSILQAREEAINIASADATQKASQAQSEAIAEARAYTDNRLTNVSNELTVETDSKLAALRDAVPTDFRVAGTSTACFLASAASLDAREATQDGVRVMEHFSEVTNANVTSDDESLTAKLLFVNGVAAGEDWTTTRDAEGRLHLVLSGRLAQHVFADTDNHLMLLAEYQNHFAIVAAA